MKFLFFLLTIISCQFIYAQEWSAEHKEVLTSYHLTQQDHRGFIFYSTDMSEGYETLEEAIVDFLESKSVLDITKVYVKDVGSFAHLEGTVLDMFLVIDTYLKFKK